jgi:hypothetical protein
VFISLRSRNFPDRFVRHQNFLGELTPIQSDLDRQDGTFEIQEFTGGQVRLVATNPSLVHQFNPPPLLPPGGEFPPDIQLLSQDSLFVKQPGLAGGGVSFRSVNFPDRFIRHRDFHLFVESPDSELARNDATFDEMPPFVAEPPPPVIG